MYAKYVKTYAFMIIYIYDYFGKRFKNTLIRKEVMPCGDAIR